MISVFQKENQVTTKTELHAYFGELVFLRLRILLGIWSMKIKPGDLDNFSNGCNAIFDIEEPLGSHSYWAASYQLCSVSQRYTTHEQMGWMSS